MPTRATSEFSPPKSWDEFEDIIWEIFRRLWRDPEAKRYGRSGQAQQGVDSYGRDKARDNALVGVQCKRYATGQFTRQVLEGEIAKAEAFQPPLDRYIIATTDKRDAPLQEAVRLINQERGAAGKFTVDIWFWEDVCSALADPANEDLLKKYYPQLWGQVHGVPTPPAAPALYGRDELLEELVDQLTQNQRLALVGLPGVGKTALALALANQPIVDKAFPEGRAWSTMGPKAELFGELGRALAMFGTSGQDLTEEGQRADRLREALDGKACLLVLDDIWQADQARPFLDACQPPAKALLTTRRAQLADDLGATCFPVPKLDINPAQEMLAGAGQSARAAVNADLEGAGKLAEAAGRLPLALHVIGRQLNRLARADGPPGAIQRLNQELAASRKRMLKPRAADPHPGLEGAEPSLEAILALSYQAFPDDESRCAFRHLAVFGAEPLSFTAGAMAAVWEDEEGERAEDLRIALVDSGLLERLPAEAIASPRYSLHQVIAAFAAALLAEDPAEEIKAMLSHARHYAEVVASYDDDIKNKRMTYATPLEWDNVILALDRLAGRAQMEDEAAQVLVIYSHFWRNVLFNNHHPRRAAWLEAAVSAAHRVGDKRDQANVLQAQGDVLYFQKDTQEALQRYEQALGLFRAVGARLGEANTLKAQGILALEAGEEERGLDLLEAARQLYASTGARVGLSNISILLADHAARRGELTAAIQYLQPALDFATEIGHPLAKDLQDRIEAWRSQLEGQAGEPE